MPFLYPQAFFRHWIPRSQLKTGAFPACQATKKHRNFPLSFPCSWGIKADALLSQNQMPCCSDSFRARLISPGVSYHTLARITGWQKIMLEKVSFSVIKFILFYFNVDEIRLKTRNLWGALSCLVFLVEKIKFCIYLCKALQKHLTFSLLLRIQILSLCGWIS